MSLEKSSNEVEFEKVCGNCFWVKYCHSQFKGVFRDSICLFQPSTFEPAIPDSGYFIRASPVGSEVFPEAFFDEENLSVRENHLDLAQKYLLLDALMRKQWSQKRAAEYLGVSQRTVNYLCRKHGLRHPNWWKFRPDDIES